VYFRTGVAAVFLGAIGLTIAAPAESVPIQNGFLTGNSYRDLASSEKRGYVMGFLDGAFVSPLFGAPKNKVKWLEDCAVGMTDEQVVAILDKWLTENPGRWHQRMNVLSFDALKEGCAK
jgi:hypothetical protein